MRFFWRRRQSDLSINDPLLAEEDGLAGTSHQPGELDALFITISQSLLNASPTDIASMQATAENNNMEEITEVMGSPNASANYANDEPEFSSIDISQESLFKMAVDDCKTEWVEFFLKTISDKSIPFEIAASMMKENLNNLWLDHRFLLEDMMKNDVLGWDICKIEVPLETFTTERNMGCRVGTCNSISEWLEASQARIGHEHWRSLNPTGVDKVLKKSRERKVNAIVKIYCIENACHNGLDGIVRVLLMHNASSSLFGTPLLKWVIIYKWERTWKTLAFNSLLLLVVLFVGFHVFVLAFTFKGVDHVPLAFGKAVMYFSLIVWVLLLLLALRREYFQLKRSILDGRKIFSANAFRRFRSYLGSRINQLDFMLSVLMWLIFGVLGLALADTYDVVENNVLYSTLSIAVLLIWTKSFYLSQAFKQIGLSVEMIVRAFQECAPYFIVLFGIAIGVGPEMCAAISDILRKDDDQPPESESTNTTSTNCSGLLPNNGTDHGNEDQNGDTSAPIYKSALLMAAAMLGPLDEGVLSHCGSSNRFMIPLFVAYLVLQFIVIVSKIIEGGGDAFDACRPAEEELLLMDRAKFIDQCEASLSNKAIQNNTSKTGKYLYVLIPEDKKLEENDPFWKERVPSIKEDVAKIVKDSQTQQSQNMHEMLKTLREDIKNDMRIQEERIIGGFEERIVLLEQSSNDQNRSHRILQLHQKI